MKCILLLKGVVVLKRLRITALDSPVPYSDLKLAVNSFIMKKWQREWDGQIENKLKKITSYIADWPTFTARNIDVILMCLRVAQD